MTDPIKTLSHEAAHSAAITKAPTGFAGALAKADSFLGKAFSGNDFIGKFGRSLGLNSLGGAIGGVGALMSAFKGDIMGTITNLASTAVSFIPVVGPFLAPLVGPVIGGIVNWFKKRKAKKVAKKFKKQVETIKNTAAQQIQPLQAQIDTLKTQPQSAQRDQQIAALEQQIVGIRKNANDQILGAWNALPQKDKERLMQFAEKVPAAAEAIRLVSDAEVENNNIAFNQQLAGITGNTYGQQVDINKAYRNAAYLWTALARDQNGKALQGPLGIADLQRWSGEVIKNAPNFLDKETYDTTNNSAEAMNKNIGYLAQFATTLKANNPNNAEIAALDVERLKTDSAYREQFISSIDALETKAENNSLTAAERTYLTAIESTESGMVNSNPDLQNESMATVVKSYRLFGITAESKPEDIQKVVAEINAVAGSTPAEKFANYALTKFDGNKDGKFDRTELMASFGVDKNMMDLYNMIELPSTSGMDRLYNDTKMSLEETKKEAERILKNMGIDTSRVGSDFYTSIPNGPSFADYVQSLPKTNQATPQVMLNGKLQDNPAGTAVEAVSLAFLYADPSFLKYKDNEGAIVKSAIMNHSIYKDENGNIAVDGFKANQATFDSEIMAKTDIEQEVQLNGYQLLSTYQAMGKNPTESPLFKAMQDAGIKLDPKTVGYAIMAADEAARGPSADGTKTFKDVVSNETYKLFGTAGADKHQQIIARVKELVARDNTPVIPVPVTR